MRYILLGRRLGLEWPPVAFFQRALEDTRQQFAEPSYACHPIEDVCGLWRARRPELEVRLVRAHARRVRKAARRTWSGRTRREWEKIAKAAIARDGQCVECSSTDQLLGDHVR